MKTYEVKIKSIIIGGAIVKANNKKEAKQIALESINNYGIGYYSWKEVDYKTKEIREILN